MEAWQPETSKAQQDEHLCKEVAVIYSLNLSIEELASNLAEASFSTSKPVKRFAKLVIIKVWP